jgi:hypothetical protein
VDLEFVEFQAMAVDSKIRLVVMSGHLQQLNPDFLQFFNASWPLLELWIFLFQVEEPSSVAPQLRLPLNSQQEFFQLVCKYRPSFWLLKSILENLDYLKHFYYQLGECRQLQLKI